MSEQDMKTEGLLHFRRYLEHEERSESTREKYLCEVRQFLSWLDGRVATKEAVAAWKAHLISEGCEPSTINCKLAAVNAYLRSIGRQDCRVKSLKVQRRVFRSSNRELTQEEYQRLLDAARSRSKPRLALLMETICGTGIRVSELRSITVEAATAGKAEIALKGKIRTILLPGKLCRKLLKYAKAQKIASGEIFLTRSGKPISRKQVWAEMKALSEAAGVEPTKVFPHNLRHLFARCFYRACRDIARLADVLGHSRIETTRIYLISTGAEHAETLERLRLIS